MRHTQQCGHGKVGTADRDRGRRGARLQNPSPISRPTSIATPSPPLPSPPGFLAPWGLCERAVVTKCEWDRFKSPLCVEGGRRRRHVLALEGPHGSHSHMKMRCEILLQALRSSAKTRLPGSAPIR